MLQIVAIIKSYLGPKTGEQENLKIVSELHQAILGLLQALCTGTPGGTQGTMWCQELNLGGIQAHDLHSPLHYRASFKKFYMPGISKINNSQRL